MSAPVVSETPTLEELLPDYEVGQELGRGAMGIVYLGRHKHLDREVAIKKLPAVMVDDPEVRSRFITEARTLAKLDHPNIVPVYDFVDRDGVCLLVMEALRGGTLWERFTNDGLTMQASVALIIATALGVEHAHSNQVLHRDIKPENLMFAGPGQIKVTDFGIAKVVNGEQTMATMDGTVLGTPAYMAPEQAGGEKIGPAADVYAIAAVLFELLSGRLPFEGDSPMSLLVQRLMEDPPDIRSFSPSVPDAIAEVIASALIRNQDERLGTAAELALSLTEAAEHEWGIDWAEGSGIELGPIARPSGSSDSNKDDSNRPAPRTIAPSSSASRPAPATVAPIGQVELDNADQELEEADQEVEGLGARSFSGSEPEDAQASSATPLVSSVVRPSTVHVRQEPIADRSHLVDLASIIKPPGRVWPLVMAASVSTCLALFLVWTAPSLEPSWGVGGDVGLTVLGIPDDEVPAQDDTLEETSAIENGPDEPVAVELTLDSPFTVSGIGIDLASVSVDYSGVEVWSDEPVAEAPVREIDLGAVGYAMTGPLTISLRHPDRPSTEASALSITVVSTRPWYLSAQGPVLVVLVLACLSMLEFRLRSFRKGDVRLVRLAGSAVTAAVLAAASSLLYALYVSRPVALEALTKVAVIGAGAAVLVALARARVARARRRRRAISFNTNSRS